MVVSLDKFLNWTIPPLAVMFFLWVFYKALKGPFGGIGDGIRRIIDYVRGGREEEFDVYSPPIQYE